MKLARVADLDCVLAGGDDGEGGGDGPMVVLLHGFGAPGDDLVALAEWIDAPEGTRWVFPAGPLTMPPVYGDARAWWMIDLEKLERELAGGGRAADRAAEVPAGLADARAAMLAVLDALARDHRRRDDAFVLGGFSQGAMLSVDLALHGARPRGLVLLSGTLLAETVWRPRAAAVAGLRVFQSHGTKDGLLSFAGAEKLRDFLAEAGAEVGFAPFPGGHEIPPPVLELVEDFLPHALAPR
ncbi:MAG TPA: hypothetical protein VM261_09280 [Kofleriaceae bacterium]|nr:hypothetical protein [Kofleriaceae bacterium]